MRKSWELSNFVPPYFSTIIYTSASHGFFRFSQYPTRNPREASKCCEHLCYRCREVQIKLPRIILKSVSLKLTQARSYFVPLIPLRVTWGFCGGVKGKREAPHTSSIVPKPSFFGIRGSNGVFRLVTREIWTFLKFHEIHDGASRFPPKSTPGLKRGS